MTILLDSLFFAVAVGHMGVDILNGSVGVLLAYLSGPLGMNNTMLGAASTAYHFIGALAQPFFGYLTDHIGPRWVVAGGMLWMGGCFAVAVLNPGSWTLAFLIAGSIGSGAFHPAGTMQATLVGRERFTQRETSSSSYFFLLGQAGLFIGPLFAGILLEWQGTRGLLILIVPIIPIAWHTARQLKWNAVSNAPKTKDNIGDGKIKLQIGWMALGMFAVLAAFRSMVQQNMITFIPKYLSDLGRDPTVYGFIAASFMGGSAIGNLIGGTLADRLGGHRVAGVSLLLCALPLVALPGVRNIGAFYLLVPIAGALNGASHSIVVVFAQRILPGGMATASGTILGFMFAMGALGSLWTGYFADIWGVSSVFWLSAGLAIVAGALTGVLDGAN